jgi:hypothetical protein
MSSATAIGMVSESLRNLLLGEMNLLGTDGDVTILAPDEKSKEPRINLYLYKVMENPALKNMDWQVKRSSPNQLVPPPLSLNLFYLMTAYNQNDQQTGNSSIHRILGDAMRVFYEYPIVPRDYLSDELKDSREQIKIMLNPLDLDELSKVWATFTTPFRLSALYEISVVQLDMLPEHERVMAERVRTIGVPQVEAPYTPPVIERIKPTSKSAGSFVRVFGRNFTGWKAYVYINGRKIVDGRELDSDRIRFKIPADLQPGFYEIKVDISHLCRQTFFFEVTPAG